MHSTKMPALTILSNGGHFLASGRTGGTLVALVLLLVEHICMSPPQFALRSAPLDSNFRSHRLLNWGNSRLLPQKSFNADSERYRPLIFSETYTTCRVCRPDSLVMCNRAIPTIRSEESVIPTMRCLVGTRYASGYSCLIMSTPAVHV